jgi:hypothetical protein
MRWRNRVSSREESTKRALDNEHGGKKEPFLARVKRRAPILLMTDEPAAASSSHAGFPW